MDPFGYPQPSVEDVQYFLAASTAAGVGWQTWRKPPGKTMLHILLFGPGGNGGNGAVGANSTAAGGGGGGSGSQTSLLIPLHMLPDVLYLSLPYGGVAAPARISTYPEAVANTTVALANQGGAGGNAAGATAGAAGAAGAVATLATMPLGGAGISQLLAGQAGIIGGTTVAGAALTLPVTGLYVTGGTGGGGLPAAAATGTNGGSFTVAGYHPSNTGGAGPAVATTPAGDGSYGLSWRQGLRYMYGGTGGSSTHGTATGAGLVAGRGGDGGFGCGGGGGGGGLTGSTQGLGGRGGDSFAVLVAW